MRGLDVVINLQAFAIRIELADIDTVGMSQSGGPQFLAVSTDDARTNDDLITAVAVEIGGLEHV